LNRNEFELGTSGDINGTCWANVSLNSLSLGQVLTTFGTLDLTTDGTPVMIVSETFHTDLDSGETGSAASNVHQTGPDNTTGVIRILVLP